jgi:hypothetical protein
MSEQKKLFGFDGSTYEPPLDKERLSAQFLRVKAVMSDGQWRSLAELSEATKSPEASVSARLRDLRKPRHGCRIVERKRITRGLFHYRLLPVEIVP